MTEAEGYIEDIFDGGHRRVEAISLPKVLAPAAMGLALTSPAQAINPANFVMPQGHPPPIWYQAPAQKAQPPKGVKTPANPQKPANPGTQIPAPQAAMELVRQMTAEVVGQQVTIVPQTAEQMRDAVGWANAYVILDGSTNVYIGPTIQSYLARPDTPLFIQGVAEVLHEAYHLKFFFEDGQNPTRSVNEAVVNRAAIADVPRVFAKYFNWFPAQQAAWEANRALIQLTPERYH